jgi:hypothetical protein
VGNDTRAHLRKNVDHIPYEYDLPEFNNPEHIMKVIKNAEDIWGATGH